MLLKSIISMSRTCGRCFLTGLYDDDRYMIFYKTVCCLNANGSLIPKKLTQIDSVMKALF
jgi:hypothetical protein